MLPVNVAPEIFKAYDSHRSIHVNSICYFLHALGFELLSKCWALGKFITISLSGSLLYLLVILSYQEIYLLCCKPFATNLSIILKELLGFSSYVFRGFS